ncbi:hypothetical protein GCM10023176_24150 [Micromonospora coerulea]|uniref:Uncharacterized protein n=1 Tax=Micromonospora coerulea TaxID=47856 RepID=A0ABP8SIZ2_9ACTN
MTDGTETIANLSCDAWIHRAGDMTDVPLASDFSFQGPGRDQEWTPMDGDGGSAQLGKLTGQAIDWLRSTELVNAGTVADKWRNHRNPTGDDMPAAVAASSVITPRLIAAQNLTLSSRHATVGRPGEGI